MIYKKIGKVFFTTSWDDGSPFDLRLEQLLIEYDIPATFYIAPKCDKYGMLPQVQIKRMMKNRLFELGGHTLTHPEDIKQLNYDGQLMEIKMGKRQLKQLSPKGKEITSFCYPRGRYNEDTIKAIKEAGFREARTCVPLCNKVPKDNFRMDVTIQAHPKLRHYKGRNWVEFAKEIFNDPETDYFHLWGHSWEVEKHGAWYELEELLKFIHDKHTHTL